MEIAKFYVINLEHRNDRRETALKHLETAGIENYEFVKGVHHKELAEEYILDMLNRKYKFKTNRESAKRGLLGCGISHIKAVEKGLQDFGEDGTKAIAVFEDDFHILDEKNFLAELQKGLDLAPPDWELIHLGGMGKENIDKTTPYKPGLDLATSVWGAHAYLVKNTPGILKKFKDAFDEGYFADRATRKFVRDDKNNLHRYLIFKPYLVVQWKSFSDIDQRLFTHSNVTNKFS